MGHIHAALMAEYAKDALETDEPWERWEYRCSERMPWKAFKDQMFFAAVYEYRRKPVALCQVEGRDVFPGDKLWWTPREGANCSAEWVVVGTLCYGDCVYSDQGRAHAISRLSWTEPVRTKTVYQWAFTDGYDWKCSRNYPPRLHRTGGTGMSLFNEQAAELLALRASVKSLGEKLEASQAREARLRDAISAHEKACKSGEGWAMYYDATLHRPLSFPTDDSALKARLEVERERCAKVCDVLAEEGFTTYAAAREIRNLGGE